jgi:hypothetical protein
MHHITVNTGHVRWSPRDEVDRRLLSLLRDHLHAALHGRAPVPGFPAFATHATHEQNVLMATISRRRDEGWVPIVTLAVVPASGDLQGIWTLLRRGPSALPIADAPPPDVSAGPWCLVRLWDVVALLPREELEWLGDYERCLAWAWLEVPEDHGAAS